ncbi:MAG: glycoside hydrolase family 3 N-terminal domain-containing protein [bacterium]|nr:glycoside hydrolase family 3 N-terminal domain-containing protein [bacterium]
MKWTSAHWRLAAVLCAVPALLAAAVPDYRNPKLSVERRVEDLLGRMTVEEKVAQLQCRIDEGPVTDAAMKDGIGGLGCVLRPYTGAEAAKRLNAIQKFMVSRTRLGIPVMMHDEALHGLIAEKATSFPQAIGLAATWDPDLMGRVAGAIADETKSRGIRQVLSPTINIARDPRWGRVEETYGEDPFLTSAMAVAFVSAFEKRGVVTTPKHYAANVGDGGRDSNPAHFSERLMREIYFPAFQASVAGAGARSIMAAYNSVDGTPCSSNRWLLTDVLRGEWGFRGYVVSDYTSVEGIYALHRTAADSVTCAEQAIEAGLDVELPSVVMYGKPLLEAVRSGRVAMETLDRAVRRVLAVKFELGLFENPYADPKEAARLNDCAAHRALAREAAEKSLVLLKNAEGALPLPKDLRSVAVIGAPAAAPRLGGYSGSGMAVVSVLEGIRRALPAADVRYARGPSGGSRDWPAVPSEWLTPAGGKEGEHGLLGEYFANTGLEGRPVLTRVDPNLFFDWGHGSPDASIAAERFSVRWTGFLEAPVGGPCVLAFTTDDGVRVYLDGARILQTWSDRAPSTDTVHVTLQAGRKYGLRVEYYENSGQAYAAMGWDVSGKDPAEAEIREAVETAEACDAAVIVAGVNEGEGRDRSDLGLHPDIARTIRGIAATGKPTVVVLTHGGAVTVADWIASADAVLEAWYPGEEGGAAVAAALFGDVNPGGKLPVTFPISVGQVPLYYNTKPTGRGYNYVDLTGSPQFAFGAGLSYTTFEYGGLRLSAPVMRPDGEIRAAVDVRNTGSRKGDEVVQLYIHDRVGSVSRPLQELKGFRRVTLEPGETKTVEFPVGRDQLAMLDGDMRWVVEPGLFELRVGGASDDIRSRAVLEVTP